MNSKPQILIAGYYGRRNAGDEVILQGMLSALRERCAPVNFLVVSADPDETERSHQVRAVAWSDMLTLTHEVEKSALVIVGGGGLFQDQWGFDPSSFLSSRQGGISEFGGPLIWAQLLGKASMLYGVGVGPLREESSRSAVRALFEIADSVIVRDMYSKRTLKDIGFDVKRVSVKTDPAFSTPKTSIEAIVPALSDVPRPLLGISVRPWTFSGSQARWESEVVAALDRYADAYAGTIVLVPLQDGDREIEDDVSVCERIRERMRNSDRVLPIDHSIPPIHRVSIFENCDLVLGMRMHSLVGAIRGGVPCVGLVYDPKVQALMESVKLADHAITLDAVKATDIFASLVEVYENREEIRTYLNRTAKRLAKRAASIAEHAALLLERDPSQRSASFPLVAALLRDRSIRLQQAEREQRELHGRVQETQAQLDAAEESSIELKKHLDQTQQQLQSASQKLIEQQTRYRETQTQLDAVEESREQLQENLTRTEERLQQVEVEVVHKKDQLRVAESRIAQAVAEEKNIRTLYEDAQHEWAVVKASKGWRVLRFVWGVVWRARAWSQRFLSFSSTVERIIVRVMGGLLAGIKSFGRRLLPMWLRGLLFSLLAHRYEVVDRSRVVLFTDDDRLFQSHEPRCHLRGDNPRRVKFSLVVTTLNEAHSAESWMKTLEAQSRFPDEVIIVDGGSVDGTAEILKHGVETSPLNLTVYIEDGINIAQGRNLAIERAKNDVIVVADFGSDLAVDYLANIVRPFEVQPETQVVSGWFEPLTQSRIGEWLTFELVPRLRDVDPQTFLPSARAMAFRKTVWREIGGYPEWLTLTGDDTYFALELKRTCRHWAFVPHAVVHWHAPQSLCGFWRKLVSWSAGDGESNVFAERYLRFALITWIMSIVAILAFIVTLASFLFTTPLTAGTIAVVSIAVLWVSSNAVFSYIGRESNWLVAILGQWARSVGFVRGVKRRPDVTLRRYGDVEGVAFIFSGIPIDDSGGGSRGAQLARQFLARNHLVVYVYKFEKAEHAELNLPIWHPRLLHVSVSDMDWEAFLWQYEDLLTRKRHLAFVEFPLKDFIPYLASIKQHGGSIVYDLIDDWETTLGGSWYAKSVEQEIWRRSDWMIATAPSLVRRLQERSGRAVYLVPNAVNLDLFDRRKKYERPEDLPSGEPQIIYVGALWGVWFDWSLLERVATVSPGAAITVIGDVDGRARIRSPNVHFLGLKAQRSLPAYLAHADIAIIPWKVDSITQATSPLKVYEYLAMGLPVVAPRITPLEGIPNVFCAADEKEFCELIRTACFEMVSEQRLESFLLENSWKARIDFLIDRFRDGQR